ncbi:Activating signal cointegrator 1 complex subunit 2 [Oopsacas minuta]|uniref:Activating signal cointegrator 1 complex subunit 2 n=1 Tax=Oopsacas minuta TaxID=111878 RepID=A0AAV7K7T8_9METZ|nr:Activating signal cointegrator 1 complex subunit 2 [Oopsacas minuta]
MEKESGLESILISYTNPITSEIEEIPSLHEKWLLDIDFFPYWKYPPALLHDDQDLWLRSLHALRDDVITLLRLPLHIFWSHVIYDPKLHILLDSFLKITPDIIEDSPELLGHEVFQSYLEVMFKVFLRMGTNREAQYTKNRTYPDFSATAFADLLYDNYLFDLPKILDLCQIFSSNRNLLGEMLEGIFRKQKKYFYDIQEMIRTTLSMLSKISEEMGCKLHLGDEDRKLARLGDNPTKQLSFDRFYEIILFVEDIFTNLESFFVTCPSASQCFTPLFMNHFVTFYELFLPGIVQLWLLYKHKLCDKQEFIKSSLRKTKFNFCKIFSYIFENCYFKKFQVTPLVLENIQAPLEDFLTICNILIGTKHLLSEYLKIFDLKTEFSRMKDSGIIDAIQFGYLTEPLSSDEPKSEPKPEPELEEAIVSIQAILPDVDTASIREVLRLHNLNVPHAINTLFERIPTIEIPPTARIKEVLVPKPLELVSQRRNIFTGDKFDIFTRDDIDTSLIHRGKKDRFCDGRDFLNNRDLSDATLKLANMELEYDDEYDDTYDDIPCDVGVDKEDTECIERLNPKGMYSNRYTYHTDLQQGSDEDEVEPIQPVHAPQFVNRKPDNRGYQHHQHQNAYTREATRGDKHEQRGHHTRKKGSAGREQHHWDNAGYYGGRRGTGGQDKGAKTKY